MRVRLALTIFIATAVLLGTPSFADRIVYSNFIEPGNQYGPDGLGIGHTPFYGPGETGEFFGATGFTPGATFQLVSIEIT
jgi:hypothetical protein